jgi:predicted O-linked N-acetylglucosamine transferase (SPINDLY family)
MAAGRPEAALADYRRALAVAPADTAAWINRGNALAALGRRAEETVGYRRALAVRSDDADALNNWGIAYQSEGRSTGALACFGKALSVRPDYAAAWVNRGIALGAIHRFADAVTNYDRALAARPSDAQAWCNRGNALSGLNRYGDAVASFTKAIEAKPDYALAHSNLIFCLDLIPGLTFADHGAERRRWDERHGRRWSTARRPHVNPRDPERVLRLGYVSADFRRHSAAYCFGPVLRHHDKDRFEVFCYGGNVDEDDVTQSFRMSATAWRYAYAMSDDALAECIRNDGIDILVDLSGHTAGNRLLVFARRPAPIQVTAWGHATGTGLTTIDYFFADGIAVPKGMRQHFAERIYDLPCIVCFEIPDLAPPVAHSPVRLSGRVTFGCLNRLDKVPPESLAVWAEVLRRVPGSTLVLKDGRLDADIERQKMRELFSRLGIDATRLQLYGRTTRYRHLETYGGIDIALEPFGQTGGVTTLEALWMGAPVVSSLGPSAPSRVSAAILAAVGLHDWIADGADAYVALAAAKALSGEHLADLRRRLRAMVEHSPVGDGADYTRAVENAYRTMWRRWCGEP